MKPVFRLPILLLSIPLLLNTSCSDEAQLAEQCETQSSCETTTETKTNWASAGGIGAGVVVLGALAGGVGSSGGGSGGASASETQDADSSNGNIIKLTGILMDSAVSGVDYRTSSGLKGFTSIDGEFEYQNGDQIEFKIGDVVLGNAVGGNIITPVELANSNNTADQRVINISRLLQTLDEDSDPNNGISINISSHNSLTGQNLDFDTNLAEFSASVNSIGGFENKELVSADGAINHLHSSIVSVGRPGILGSDSALQQLIPGFVSEPPSGEGSNCIFSGGTVPNGGSVVAYQNESVQQGLLCSSQTRNCKEGDLDGSFEYPSCVVEASSDCEFNGATIADGISLTAYQSVKVLFGNSCQSQTRTCTKGVLSGNYAFSSCNVADPQGCSFGIQSVAHGSFVTAYLSDTVPFGSTCSSQLRTCFNGTLSGIYGYPSCKVSPATCSFNGQSVTSGGSVIAFQSSEALDSSCVSETRICSNGTLSGSYLNNTCMEVISGIFPPIDMLVPNVTLSIDPAAKPVSAKTRLRGGTIVASNTYSIVKSTTPTLRITSDESGTYSINRCGVNSSGSIIANTAVSVVLSLSDMATTSNICSVTVTDDSGNVQTATLSPFQVDATGPSADFYLQSFFADDVGFVTNAAGTGTIDNTSTGNLNARISNMVDGNGVGVKGYFLSESSSAPAVESSDWVIATELTNNVITYADIETRLLDDSDDNVTFILDPSGIDEGLRTVYLHLLDFAGNISTISDTIFLMKQGNSGLQRQLQRQLIWSQAMDQATRGFFR